MGFLIFTAITFLTIQPVWNVDQNYFYFHRANHPSVLSTVDEHPTVSLLDLVDPNMNNQRLQVRSAAESDKPQLLPEATVPPSNVSPDTPAVAAAEAPTLQPQQVLQIPPQNPYQQLYGPAQVTSYFHNTLAGPLPLPFPHLAASTYQNIVAQPLQPQLPNFGNAPLIFQRPVPVPQQAPLPVVNVQPSPIPQPLFIHPSTISNAQGFFEVRQPAVTGYAYSIGSNDKIVATSSFTLGSSKHDPSFSRFKFLGQRPFENFENPYSSHLFQGKATRQTQNSVTPAPTLKTTSKPVVEITKPTQKPKESIPDSVKPSPTAPVQEEQKVSETKISKGPGTKQEKVSDEESLPSTEEIVSEKNIPDVIEAKLPEFEKLVPEVVETKVEEKVVPEIELDVPEVDDKKVPSVEVLDVEKEEVPQVIAEDVSAVDKNSVSEVNEEKVPEVDDDLVSGVDAKSVPEVEKTMLPEAVHEKTTRAVDPKASESNKASVTNDSSEPIIPEGEVLVPNTGRVKGIPIVVSDGNKTRASPYHRMEVKPEHQKRNIYTDFEKTAILELVSIHKDTLENKQTDKVTLGKKSAVWKQVTRQFNAQNGVVPRTAESIKKCWDSMKTLGKREFRNEKVEKFRTGGGKAVPGPSATSIAVHALVSSQIESLENEFDDDFFQEEELQQILTESDKLTHSSSLNPIVLPSSSSSIPTVLTANNSALSVVTNQVRNDSPERQSPQTIHQSHEETLKEYERLEHRAKMSFLRQKTSLNTLKRRVLEDKLETSKAERAYWEEKKKKLEK